MLINLMKINLLLLSFFSFKERLMETADKTFIEANDATELADFYSKKDSENNNGSVTKKMSQANGCDDLTTAVGGTIDEDIEYKPVGESKESEEDLKEILTRKLAELETKLKQYVDILSK